MAQLNSFSVQDNENKYRYGVLIGNFHEETFGMDLEDRFVNTQTPQSIMKTSYTLHSSSYNNSENSNAKNSKEKNFEDREKEKLLMDFKNGQKGSILIGHGLDINDFTKTDMESINELVYKYHVPTKTIINPKFDAKKHLEKLKADGNCKGIKKIGSEEYNDFLEEKGKEKIIPKPYNQFTKKFDSDHIRSGLRDPL